MIAIDRRHVMQLGAAMAAVATGPAAAAEAVVDTGSVKDGKVSFPAWTAETERPSGGPPNLPPLSERVGIAVVGLGRLSLEEILPAFAMSKRARLTGLVSGTPDKAGLVAAQYGIPAQAVYGYDDWDAIGRNPAIEAVYIVLPNALHKAATLRAAAAGKHVLCEKPMANSAADCLAMIEACERAQRTLMIAYRCQYEPHNRAVQALVRSGSLGAAGLLSAVNVQNMAAPSHWRFNKALAGGGALPDIGLYCLNGARFLVGEEPVEVIGRTFSPAGDDRFREVEATVAFMLRFPSGFIANCSASYGLHEHRGYSLHLPAAAIDLQKRLRLRGDSGLFRKFKDLHSVEIDVPKRLYPMLIGKSGAKHPAAAREDSRRAHRRAIDRRHQGRHAHSSERQEGRRGEGGEASRRAHRSVETRRWRTPSKQHIAIDPKMAQSDSFKTNASCSPICNSSTATC